MSMVVQHNLQAMNANRLLGVTTGLQSKSTEKLSSGYKINRAADDAAGLTISEKMRRQIRGLTQASTNAQDGVSSVQTAEGALTEVHSMLQRMNELATQAANGTESQNDRDAIQAEIDQLCTEIDRVAETTKFNEIYLLKGDEGKKTVKMAAHDAGLKGTLVDNGDGTATFTMDELKAGDSVNIGGKAYKIINDAEQTEAKADEDYSLKGTNAVTTVDLANWASGGTVSINGTTYDYATYNAASDVAGQLKTDLGDDYAVTEDGSGKITITAAEVGTKAVKIDSADVDNDGTDDVATIATETDGTVNSVTANTKLYAKDGTEALTDEEMVAAINKGEKLYTTPGVKVTQTKKVDNDKDLDITGTNAVTTIDLGGWAANGSVSINGTTYDQATYAAATDVAAQLETDLGDDYKVTEDGSGKITITAVAVGTKAVKIESADVDGDGTDDAAANATETDGTITAVKAKAGKSIYAENGTEALTDEEIQKAVEDGDTLYLDAAGKADNEITASEAYALAKEELLKANQIGDLNETASVTYGSAAAGAAKTAADYTVGDTVEIDGTTYTIASTDTETQTKINDTITAAVTAAATPANSNNTTACTAVGSVSDGTNTINIFKKGDGGVVYSTAATLTHAQAASATADKTAADVDALAVAGATVTFTDGAGTATAVVVADDSAGSTTISAARAADLENAAGGAAAGAEASNVFNITTASADVAKTLSFNLHVGADADMTNKIQVDIETMNCSYLGIKNLDLSDKDGLGATYAIDAIADAISKVSAQRSALGAIQNRLEHTISNLDNVVENTTSAESRIRDTDMASEMVEYSKNNILAQAGQSMLAQANQSTQGVLSLLQ